MFDSDDYDDALSVDDDIDREYEDNFDLLDEGDELYLCEVCQDRYAYRDSVCLECLRQRMIDQS